MKMYVLVILKTGSKRTEDKALLDSLFAGHFSNMKRLVEEKKLTVAGPLENNEKKYRGIFILDVPTVEEAQKIIATDPAVNAKIFDIELYPCYGSAALPLYLKDADRVRKKQM